MFAVIKTRIARKFFAKLIKKNSFALFSYVFFWGGLCWVVKLCGIRIFLKIAENYVIKNFATKLQQELIKNRQCRLSKDQSSLDNKFIELFYVIIIHCFDVIFFKGL